MSSLFFARLFCCCNARPRRAVSAAESAQVIPNETSRLLDPPTTPTTPVVDRKTLTDRLGSIVRAKEGKMVSVSSRTPFTLESTSDEPDHDDASLSTLNDSDSNTTDRDRADATAPRTPTATRQPRVLTMTPARPQTAAFDRFHFHSGRSRGVYASSDGTRERSERSASASGSSSRRRASRPRRTEAHPGIEEEETEPALEDEAFAEPPHASPVARPIGVPRTSPNAADDIAFSWSDV